MPISSKPAATAHNANTRLISLPTELRIQVLSHLFHINENNYIIPTRSLVSLAGSCSDMRETYKDLTRNHLFKAILNHQISLISHSRFLVNIRTGRREYLMLDQLDIPMLTQVNIERAHIFTTMRLISNMQPQFAHMFRAEANSVIAAIQSKKLMAANIIEYKLWNTPFDDLNEHAASMLKEKLPTFEPEYKYHIDELNNINKYGPDSIRLLAADVILRTPF